jgi:hypothetical protein
VATKKPEISVIIEWLLFNLSEMSFIELIGDQDNEAKTIFTNFLLLLDGRVVDQDM